MNAVPTQWDALCIHFYPQPSCHLSEFPMQIKGILVTSHGYICGWTNAVAISFATASEIHIYFGKLVKWMANKLTWSPQNGEHRQTNHHIVTALPFTYNARKSIIMFSNIYPVIFSLHLLNWNSFSKPV